MPSRKSSLIYARRIRSSPSSRDNVRRIRRTASLVVSSVIGAWLATSFAVSSARRCSVATSGTTSLSRPSSSASGASTSRALKIKSLVRAGPMSATSRLMLDIDRHEQVDAVLLGLARHDCDEQAGHVPLYAGHESAVRAEGSRRDA